MRVFVSWSGKESHVIALAFRDWLRYVFPTIQPYLSSEDTRKGVMWGTDIATNLSVADHGLVVLTLSNYGEPWILYEAGALSKSLNSTSLWTILAGGIAPEHLQGSPLSLFQHTRLEKDDVLRLARAINGSLSSGIRTDAELIELIENTWPGLQTKISAAQVADPSEKKTVRIADLTHESDIIAGRTFRDLIIKGPAILIPIQDCTFQECTFGTTGDSLDPLFWIPYPESRNTHIGAIGLYQCRFFGCIFAGIGFAGPRERLDAMRGAVRSPPQSSGV